ncbi:hypothetical protein ACFIJ5_00100 [Haloimpatiens sp. FM7330]
MRVQVLVNNILNRLPISMFGITANFDSNGISASKIKYEVN